MSMAAFESVIGLFRDPSRVEEVRSRALPDGLAAVIRIAAGDEDLVREWSGDSGESAEVVGEACVFFLQQVLFAPGADSYRVLGAAPDAPQARLREHYGLLMRWLHPDRQGDDGWESIYADRVNQAWQDLKTPKRRAEYDSQPREGGASQSSSGNGNAITTYRVPTMSARPMPRGPVLSGSLVQRLPAITLGILGVAALAMVALVYWSRHSDDRLLLTRAQPATHDAPQEASHAARAPDSGADSTSTVVPAVSAGADHAAVADLSSTVASVPGDLTTPTTEALVADGGVGLEAGSVEDPALLATSAGEASADSVDEATVPSVAMPDHSGTALAMVPSEPADIMPADPNPPEPVPSGATPDPALAAPTAVSAASTDAQPTTVLARNSPGESLRPENRMEPSSPPTTVSAAPAPVAKDAESTSAAVALQEPSKESFRAEGAVAARHGATESPVQAPQPATAAVKAEPAAPVPVPAGTAQLAQTPASNPRAGDADTGKPVPAPASPTQPKAPAAASAATAPSTAQVSRPDRLPDGRREVAGDVRRGDSTSVAAATPTVEAGRPPQPAIAESAAKEAPVAAPSAAMASADRLPVSPPAPSARPADGVPPVTPAGAQASVPVSSPASDARVAAPPAQSVPEEVAARVVQEIVAAYAAGDMRSFDRVVAPGSGQQASNLRQHLLESDMRFLELTPGVWRAHEGATSAEVRFRLTVLPKGERKARTETGTVSISVTMVNGQARITHFDWPTASSP